MDEIVVWMNLIQKGFEEEIWGRSAYMRMIVYCLEMLELEDRPTPDNKLEAFKCALELRAGDAERISKALAPIYYSWRDALAAKKE